MKRLVLDTNVLLSALISPVSPSAEIYALWLSRKIAILTVAEQLDEITRVTRYPKIRALLSPALAGRLVNRLRDVAILVESLPVRPILTIITCWRLRKPDKRTIWSPAISICSV